MQPIPRDKPFDGTLALLSEGYEFIPRRCRRYRSDIFTTRLLLRKAHCVSGAEAARMFYEPGRFTRQGAVPITALKLLQDKGSVQALDGEDHRRRKRMFMALMTRESIDDLIARFAEGWFAALTDWERADQIVLFDAIQELLCRTVWAWAGLPPLQPDEARRRTREIAAMISAASAFGPRNWRALVLRRRTERRLVELLDQLRDGPLPAPDSSAAAIMARHRDPKGNPLPLETAAVELLNILRPVVAVAYYVTFAALALHRYAEWADRLRAGGPRELELFVQEVRRFYPFFPFVGGRARAAFSWRGASFAEGSWFILDLYGTNHDPLTWEQPQRFQPERFLRWDGSPFTFVPQGGGGYEANHRCPGEWITIELLKCAVRFLTTAMRYRVPQQDLTVSLEHMPTLPASRFAISSVRTLAWLIA